MEFKLKKIKNPYAGREDYNCFGCSPNNQFGLQMEFHVDGDEVISIWEPKPQFAGWKNILHGGIQTTLMDEVASWFVFTKLETGGVTYSLENRYKKPVPVDQGAIKLVARQKSLKRNLVDIEVELFDASGRLCSVGSVKYFLFDKEKAKSQLNYPGLNEFFNR